MKLRQLGLGVAFAGDEQVDLVRGRAVLEYGPDLSERFEVGLVHEAGVRIDDRRPDLLEGVLLVPFLEDDLHGMLRPGETDGLLERPGVLFGVIGRLPLAEYRGEAAREDR